MMYRKFNTEQEANNFIAYCDEVMDLTAMNAAGYTFIIDEVDGVFLVPLDTRAVPELLEDSITEDEAKEQGFLQPKLDPDMP